MKIALVFVLMVFIYLPNVKGEIFSCDAIENGNNIHEVISIYLNMLIYHINSIWQIYAGRVI